ncbi:hypothetical protein CHS0354_012576, partial [Potamilus streckersoni]
MTENRRLANLPNKNYDTQPKMRRQLSAEGYNISSEISDTLHRHQPTVNKKPHNCRAKSINKGQQTYWMKKNKGRHKHLGEIAEICVNPNQLAQRKSIAIQKKIYNTRSKAIC